MKFLYFQDEAAFEAVVSPWMSEGRYPGAINGIAIDVIGVIFKPTGVIISHPDGDYPEMEAIPGFHVNTTGHLDIFEPYEVPAPATPHRIFGGMWPPVEPVAPMVVTMTQCRLALFDLKGIQTDEEFYGLADILPDQEMRNRALVELKTRATVQKDNELVLGVCAIKGWDIEELFLYASQLN